MLFLISCECGVDHFGRSLRRPGREYRLGFLLKVIRDVGMPGRRGGPHRPPHGLSSSDRLRRNRHPPWRDALHILKSSLA